VRSGKSTYTYTSRRTIEWNERSGMGPLPPNQIKCGMAVASEQMEPKATHQRLEYSPQRIEVWIGKGIA